MVTRVVQGNGKKNFFDCSLILKVFFEVFPSNAWNIWKWKLCTEVKDRSANVNHKRKSDELIQLNLMDVSFDNQKSCKKKPYISVEGTPIFDKHSKAFKRHNSQPKCSYNLERSFRKSIRKIVHKKYIVCYEDLYGNVWKAKEKSTTVNNAFNTLYCLKC